MTKTPDLYLTVAARLTYDATDVETLYASPSERDALAYAGALARTAAIVDDSLRRHVLIARDEGATWQEIGDTLGVSRQAAQQRYGG